MNAGFFKRAAASIIDIIILLAVVSVTFFVFGRGLLQNQINHFDEIYSAYQDVVTAYNADITAASDAYDAQIEIANGDEELEAEALTLYQQRVEIINNQNLVDIEPYNRPLTRYYLNSIYYYSIGFLLLLSIYTIATNGKTLGRKLFKVALEGSVNPVTVFLHDVVFKYFFVLLALMVNLYMGLLVLGIFLVVDIILIGVTRKKRTIRDLILGITVANSSYWK